MPMRNITLLNDVMWSEIMIFTPPSLSDAIEPVLDHSVSQEDDPRQLEED
jgi:hypothetical protein